MTRLRDHTWHESFTSSQDNLLEGFYRPALQESIRYWRITGYFSSRSLLQVLDGVEQLVLASPDGCGHGQMRLITGFFMSRADLQALSSSQHLNNCWSSSSAASSPFVVCSPGMAAPLTWALNSWPGWCIKATLRSASACPSMTGRSAPMAPSFTPRKV